MSDAKLDAKTVQVGVLFGGRSGEHDVSLASAQNVIAALHQAGFQVIPIGLTQEGRWLTGGDPMGQLTANAQLGDLRSTGEIEQNPPEKQPNGWALLPNADSERSLSAVDVIFPVLHGPYGEDGTVQGLLDMANIPYVGCGVLASAVAMDKAVAKRLFAAEGLPQVRYCTLLRAEWQQKGEMILDQVEAKLPYPLFVKPANLGSSVGVCRAQDRAALAEAIDIACRYDRKIVVEQGIVNPREIEVSVLGNSHSLANRPMVSVPGEIIPGDGFYDYAAKYEDDTSTLQIPAQLESAVVEQIQEMALRAFTAIDGSGLARVDFLIDAQDDKIYLNEVNTMPGFTRISMYPKLWEASGLSYPELVARLVQLALENHADRQQNHTER